MIYLYVWTTDTLVWSLAKTTADLLQATCPHFNAKFEELGSNLDDTSWMEEMSTVMKHDIAVEKEKLKYTAKQK